MSTFCHSVGFSLGLLFMMMTGVSLQNFDCTGLPDGAYGYGCRSYTRCIDGEGTVIECVPEYAFNPETGKCEPWDRVPPPCGSSANNCTGYPDGRYPVLPDCTYYYTCSGGIFFGANPCNDPPESGDLVFDYNLQICNWIWSVPPPCGTASEKKLSAQFKSKKV